MRIRSKLKMNKTCKVCSKNLVKKNRYEQKSFCSLVCRTSFTWAKKTKKVCKYKPCSKTFIVTPCRGFRVYCSLECSHLRLFTGVTWIDRICEYCKVDFRTRKGEINGTRFCSHKCANTFNRGTNNKNWRGGATTLNQKIRQSIEYEEWRKAVFERDNYTCQHCGQIGGPLQADHIKPFASFIDLRFELSNGRTLCLDCHRKTDTWGFGTAQKLKKERVNLRVL